MHIRNIRLYFWRKIMYECPNCSANLKFHIGKQQLYCDYCETTLSPYAFQKTSDAEENNVFEATIFTCPQCGGELLTEDDTAATFCSYCGASTILFSRISKEKAPRYIIPFTKTKEDCKKSYNHMLRQAFLVPNELRNPEHIEKFRGIYMPYWLYTFQKNGVADIPGVKTETEGDYEITTHYHLKYNVIANYNDIAFDASSSFTDSLSQSIAPYDMSQKKPFSPAYLSGFYADSSDVDSDSYNDYIEKAILYDMEKQLKKDSQFTQYEGKKLLKTAKLDQTLKPEKRSIDLAMLPVWFLSYRKKDRVAYAIVNGQTGEAAADLPIDIFKFSFLSILLAIPIILVLNSFLTLTPSKLLTDCGLISAFFTFITHIMTTNVMFKESYADIKLAICQETELDHHKSNLITLACAVPLLFIEAPFLIGLFIFGISTYHMKFFTTIFSIVFIIYMLVDMHRLKKPADVDYIDKDSYRKFYKKKCWIISKPIFTMITSLLIVAINPVSDIIYYSFACFCLAMIFWSITDMIRCHNLLTTRKLPQLNKRGGDLNA